MISNLLAQYPLILDIAIFIVAVIIAVIVVLSFVQGRGISTPLISITPKPSSQNTQQFIPIPTTSTLTDTQVQEITDKIRIETTAQIQELENKLRIEAENRARQIREQSKSESDFLTQSVLYQPPELPKHVLYVYSSRIAMEKKIKEIAIKHKGAWAGSSISSGRSMVETLLFTLVKDHKIDERLAQDIRHFYVLTSPGVFIELSNDYVPVWFEDLQFLVTNIMRQLDRIRS